MENWEEEFDKRFPFRDIFDNRMKYCDEIQENVKSFIRTEIDKAREEGRNEARKFVKGVDESFIDDWESQIRQSILKEVVEMIEGMRNSDSKEVTGVDGLNGFNQALDTLKERLEKL